MNVYIAPGRGAKYNCDGYVCLYVCLSAHISRKLTSELHQIFVHVAVARFSYGDTDTLCNSGFVGDNVFSHSRLYVTFL